MPRDRKRDLSSRARKGRRSSGPTSPRDSEILTEVKRALRQHRVPKDAPWELDVRPFPSSLIDKGWSDYERVERELLRRQRSWEKARHRELGVSPLNAVKREQAGMRS